MERDQIALEAGVELTTASAKAKIIKTKPESSENGPAETHRLVPLDVKEIDSLKDGSWLSEMGLEEAKTTIKRLLINLENEKATK